MATVPDKSDPSWGYNAIPRRKNNYPRMNEEFGNLPKLIEDFIADKNSKFRFNKSTKFLLQGSCFAENLFNEMKSTGYPCFYNKVLEALNSPLANLYYLLDLKEKKTDPVYQEIATSQVYVLTIGVAPCWFSRQTGQFVFGPDLRNIHQYFQRTLLVSEAKDALLKVFRVVYEINPKMTIVLTLSPVPLRSTFEFESAIVADCVSKSVLRAAIHEALLVCEPPKPIYFPSFEIVRWAGAHAGDAFGEDGMPTHVSEKYVKQIIASFISGSEQRNDI
jgi:hypothetical protein